MYKRNDSYKQQDLFGIKNSLSAKQERIWNNSIENCFFEQIFKKINQDRFKVLYSEKKSRPNVAVNQLVGSLILKHLFNWTYEDLFRNLHFNLLTRHAIGLQHLQEDVFSEASIFNFQNRVIEHFVRTGEDLLTEVFDRLTTSQLKEFGIMTDIQRGDSFLLGSNIFDYTRLQLLIEVILRLYRNLDTIDKERFSELLSKYTKQTSGQYVFRIKKEDLPKESQTLAKIYHDLFIMANNKYSDHRAFKIFERVYYEHFIVVEDKIELLPANTLTSDSLMSPDDDQATFRKKGKIKSKGYSGHISETANPENKLNLITDVITVPNNTDDARILEERLPTMIEKTSDLNEYHADGSYGSPTVDLMMEDQDITQVQTAVRGKRPHAKMSIKEDESEEVYWVKCEYGQKVKAEKANKGKNVKRHKAVFDYQTCLQCPLKDKCSSRITGVKINRPKRTWYFSEEKIRLHKRLQNFEKLPEERQKIRANVEATVKELKRGVKNGKVRVRSYVRVGCYLTFTSIAVNLTRIHKYVLKSNRNMLRMALITRIHALLNLQNEPLISSN